jgi:glycosyltransferase involved in cell wall biosynthesis
MNTHFPKISVISPSYNQAQYLETTIRSVLNQEYPSLEYIIIDGGSTDGSADIIRRYSSHFSYWVSEKDNGQSHAINKGFAKASGEIMCWLNSDDYFEHDTLSFVADYFTANPGVDVLCGGKHNVDAEGNIVETFKGHYTGRRQLASYWRGYKMHQPSIFWRRRVYEQIGDLDERLHLTMDFDYWLRMSRKFELRSVDRALSYATIHPQQKTGDNFAGYKRAQLRDVMRYYGSPLTRRDWDIRMRLYAYLPEYLAKTMVKMMLRYLIRHKRATSK